MSSTAKKIKRNQAQYEIGEMRDQLARDLQKRIVDVINKEQKRAELYYILVHSDFDNVTGAVATKLMVMNYVPPKMIGTILYSVDNSIGQLRRLWIIPQDIPRSEEFVDYDTGMKVMNEVHKSGKDLIVY